MTPHLGWWNPPCHHHLFLDHTLLPKKTSALWMRMITIVVGLLVDPSILGGCCHLWQGPKVRNVRFSGPPGCSLKLQRQLRNPAFVLLNPGNTPIFSCEIGPCWKIVGCPGIPIHSKFRWGWSGSSHGWSWNTMDPLEVGLQFQAVGSVGSANMQWNWINTSNW